MIFRSSKARMVASLQKLAKVPDVKSSGLGLRLLTDQSAVMFLRAFTISYLVSSSTMSENSENPTNSLPRY